MPKSRRLNQYLRCIVGYTDITHYRVIHFAVHCDFVDDFTKMIRDTFVHPDISYTDMIFSYDSRMFFQII